MDSLLLNLLVQKFDLVLHLTNAIVRQVNSPKDVRLVIIVVDGRVLFMILNVLPQVGSFLGKRLAHCLLRV